MNAVRASRHGTAPGVPLRRALAFPACAAADAGFTLLEVVVATALIGITMAASTSFFVSTETVTNLSGGQQAAVQLATEGIEAVRAVPVDALRPAVDNLNGRWTPPTNPPASDDPEHPVRNGMAFARIWSVTECWQPP